MGNEFDLRSKEDVMATKRSSEKGRLARFAFFCPSLRPFRYSGTRGSCSYSCMRETSRSTVSTFSRLLIALVRSESILTGVTLVKKLVSFFSGRSQVGSTSLKR